MIDTVKLSQQLVQLPDSEILESLGCKRKFESSGKFSSWFFKEYKKSPYIQIFTAKDGKHYITAELSIPTFLFGSNVCLPTQEDVVESLEILSQYVWEKLGIEFIAQNANIWKVHFTRNYKLDENLIQKTISKLAEMRIPRFNKSQYSETTVYYQSKGLGRQNKKPRTICIYSKQHECINNKFSSEDIKQAAGVLRLEFRFNNANSISRFVKNSKLQDRKPQTILTDNISNLVLNPIEEQMLSILENISFSSNNIYNILSENFSNGRLPKLIQFLYLLDNFGEDFYKINSLKFTKSAYYRCQKDCRKVGIYSLSNFS